MELANNIFAAHRNDSYDGNKQRNKVMVVFSDGTPGYYGYSPQWAAKAVNAANRAKNEFSAKVLTVALVNHRLNADTHAYYGGRYPNSNEVEATRANTSELMNALSSNYPNAAGNETTGAISLGARASDRYFLNVTDSVDMNYATGSTFDNVARLTDAFLNIPEIVLSSQTGYTSGANLGANSVIRDYMSEYFKLNEDEWNRLLNSADVGGDVEEANSIFASHHVFVRIHSCTGYDTATGEYVFNPIHDDAEDFYEAADDLEGLNWYEVYYKYNNRQPAGISVDFDFYQKSVAVSGFDYSANYCRTTGGSAVNGVRPATGKKVVVLITGVLAEENTVGKNIPTNKDYSGVYPNPSTTTTEFVFPVPTVNIREHIVVYDFGIRLEDDDALNFFGKSEHEHDVKDILSLDDCYGEQGYFPCWFFDEPTIPDMQQYASCRFEYKTSYPYAQHGTDFYWGNEGYPASKDYDTLKDLFRAEIVEDSNGRYHAAFEPYTISHQDYTLAALLRLNDDTFEWCRLTFLPATNVLYEERIVNIGGEIRDNGFMAFTDGTGAAWEHNEGWHKSDYQDADNNIYGFDKDYTLHDDTHDSHGGAHHATVTEAMFNAAKNDLNYKWPSCEFTFSGTGFDLISRSGADTGVLAVSIVPADKTDWAYFGTQATDPITGMPMVDASGKPVMSRDYAHIVVDTVYLDGAGRSLYQIPVLHYDNLEYGEYKAIISAIYHPMFDHQSESYEQRGSRVSNIPGLPGIEYEIQRVDPGAKAAPDTRGKGELTTYIDAIRVYHPRGESIFGKGVDEISYLKANDNGSELNPEYIQVKQLFLSQNADGAGIVNLYIDDAGENVVTVEDYANNGPNNEAYIKAGEKYAVSFRLDGDYAGIHLSAKTAFPAETGAAANTVKLKVNGTVVGTVQHATELYYDITEAVRTRDGMVTVTCESDSAEAVLSLVNLKLIPAVGEANTQPAPNVVSDQSVLDFTEAVVAGVTGDANHDRQVDMIDALFVMRCSLDACEPDAYGKVCGDVDSNYALDMLDAVSIIRLTLKD